MESCGRRSVCACSEEALRGANLGVIVGLLEPRAHYLWVSRSRSLHHRWWRGWWGCRGLSPSPLWMVPWRAADRTLAREPASGTDSASPSRRTCSSPPPNGAPPAGRECPAGTTPCRCSSTAGRVACWSRWRTRTLLEPLVEVHQGFAAVSYGEHDELVATDACHGIGAAKGQPQDRGRMELELTRFRWHSRSRPLGGRPTGTSRSSARRAVRQGGDRRLRCSTATISKSPGRPWLPHNRADVGLGAFHSAHKERQGRSRPSSCPEREPRGNTESEREAQLASNAGWGPSEGNLMGVQVPPRAPRMK